MTLYTGPESEAASQAKSAQAKAKSKLQFSLSALMFAILAMAVACAALRCLGSVWLVPLVLAGLGAASLTMALRRGSSWRMLKLGYWHLAIWLAMGAAASGLTVRGCLDYNTVAGTDLTPEHIARISAAALAGPMIGPVANPGAGETPMAWRWTAILFAVLLVAASPFLFVRRIVPWAIALVSWLGFVAALVLWFFGAMISLGIFLS
jgi:hypothetical protein